MKKIGLLALALVLALGSLGIGYALWWDTLYIDGTVNTGTIGAEWSLHDGSAWDDEIDGKKDTSWVTANIVDGRLKVDIHNAYPSITYYVDFDIHSTGSVPIHFGDLVIGQSTLPENTDIALVIWDPNGTNLQNPETIPLSDVQLHQGDIIFGQLSIHLNNDDTGAPGTGAAQDADYTFSAEVDYWQYNEDGPS